MSRDRVIPPLPFDPSDTTSDEMAPLVARGRAMLDKFYETFPADERPIGGQAMYIVCEDDFAKHALLCLRHVTRFRRSLYILCDNGNLCALLEHLTWRTP